ncbi:MAG: hypothetical protein LBB72_01770 [Spirochaetaceae bacterium]|jgi:hypothetical protein|nr:hypothetical protein [Spirochaetaceae bacterium]
MQKKRFLIVLIIGICLCQGLFGQSGMGLSLGFQYGTAQIIENKNTLREITEPGLLINFRMTPGPIGFFGRFGMLFPSQVTEGKLTLSYDQYDYILFFNAGGGVTAGTRLNNMFSLVFDIGLSINNLLYGGYYTENIDTRWEIKLENIGKTYTGGYAFKDVKMSESYNDVGIGLLGNAALRFNFTSNVFLELGIAASFDFMRFKSFEFSAQFKETEWGMAKENFPDAKVDEKNRKVIFEENSKFSIFKQFTFIPSLSIGFSL